MIRHLTTKTRVLGRVPGHQEGIKILETNLRTNANYTGIESVIIENGRSF